MRLRVSQTRYVIALTGGPGGGKTTLIRELLADPAWAGRLVALPEAISVVGQCGLSPREQVFQRAMVAMQMAMEDALAHALGPDDPRALVCHRGSLDPLAYWLARGWSECAFFAFTGTSQEQHYARYAGVLHLVTAADGAAEHYARWPQAHRSETPEQAIALDRLLAQVWGAHPGYVRLDNEGRAWAAKAQAARQALEAILKPSCV